MKALNYISSSRPHKPWRPFEALAPLLRNFSPVNYLTMVKLGFAAVIATISFTTFAQSKIRYMPFGDSITDYGCWRPWIGEKFKQDGYNVDFVGSRKAGETCNNLDYDRDHEGHPGFQAYNMARERQLVDWLKQNPADVITMHLGTVDIVLANRKPAEITAAYSTLVDQMRASNPAVKIIVSGIARRREALRR
jgi:hypothetical protein